MLSAMFDSAAMILSKKDEVQRTQEHQKQLLFNQAENVKMQLRLIDELFNLTDDDDLIEACIYQSKAFDSYYRYLLNSAKREGLSFYPQLQSALQPDEPAAHIAQQERVGESVGSMG